MSPRRWFSPQTIDSAIRTLAVHSRDPAEDNVHRTGQENTRLVRNAAFAASGVAASVLVLVVVLGLFTQRKDPERDPTPRTLLLPAFLVLSLGGVAWRAAVQFRQRGGGSERAFAEIASRDDQLVAVGGRRLVGSDVGVVPWFDTEEYVTDESSTP
jgi:hypothetical protein